jgi:DNA-binding XRE family transcriptional regulator
MKSINPRLKDPDLNPRKYQQPIKVKPEHEDFLKQVGGDIEKLRQKHHINITDLCKQIGISRFTYYSVIDGKVYWNLQTILSILNHFKIDEIKFFSSLKKSVNSK